MLNKNVPQYDENILTKQGYKMMKHLLICLYSVLAVLLFSCTDGSYKSVTFQNQLDDDIEICEISGIAKQSIPLKIKANENCDFEVDPDGEEIKFCLKINYAEYLLRTGNITDFCHFELKIFKQDEEIYFRVNKHNQNEKLEQTVSS